MKANNLLRWFFRSLLLMLVDLLCLHLTYVFVVMVLKYSMGESFGAVVALRSYARVWPVFSLVYILGLALMGFYRRILPHFGLLRLFLLALAILPSFVFYQLYLPYAAHIRPAPYLTLFHAWSCFFLLGIFRLGVDRFRRWFPRFTAGRYILSKRTMIVGAGRAGISVASLLLSDTERRGHPVLFVDDDPQKIGRRYLGLKVAGNREKISALAEAYGIERIIIAIPFAAEADKREILDLCYQTSCEVIKAGFGEAPLEEEGRISTTETSSPLPEGTVERKAFENLLLAAEGMEEEYYRATEEGHPEKKGPYLSALSPEEILHRPPLSIAPSQVQPYLQGRHLALVGVGGLGGAVMEAILPYGPRVLNLMDSSALTLAQHQLRLAQETSSRILRFHPVSVQAVEDLDRVLGEEIPDYLLVMVGFSTLGVPLSDLAWKQLVACREGAVTFARRHPNCRVILVDDVDLAVRSRPEGDAKLENLHELYCGRLLDERSPLQQERLLADEAGWTLPPCEEAYDLTVTEAAQLLLSALPYLKHYPRLLLSWGEPFSGEELLLRRSGQAIPPLEGSSVPKQNLAARLSAVPTSQAGLYSIR